MERLKLYLFADTVLSLSGAIMLLLSMLAIYTEAFSILALLLGIYLALTVQGWLILGVELAHNREEKQPSVLSLALHPS